jgi:hypothetical protein
MRQGSVTGNQITGRVAKRRQILRADDARGTAKYDKYQATKN